MKNHKYLILISLLALLLVVVIFLVREPRSYDKTKQTKDLGNENRDRTHQVAKQQRIELEQLKSRLEHLDSQKYKEKIQLEQFKKQLKQIKAQRVSLEIGLSSVNPKKLPMLSPPKPKLSIEPGTNIDTEEELKHIKNKRSELEQQILIQRAELEKRARRRVKRERQVKLDNQIKELEYVKRQQVELERRVKLEHQAELAELKQLAELEQRTKSQRAKRIKELERIKVQQYNLEQQIKNQLHKLDELDELKLTISQKAERLISIDENGRDAMDKLLAGNMAHYVPDSMEVHKPSRISLTISKNMSLPELRESLEESIANDPNVDITDIITKKVKISKVMTAKLYAMDSTKLQINRISEEEQYVYLSDTDTTETKWEWSVLPLETGKYNIIMKVSAIISDGSRSFPLEFEVYNGVIPVTAVPLTGIESTIKYWKIITAFFKDNWGWLTGLTASLVSLITWLHSKFGNKKPSNAKNSKFRVKPKPI